MVTPFPLPLRDVGSLLARELPRTDARLEGILVRFHEELVRYVVRTRRKRLPQNLGNLFRLLISINSDLYRRNEYQGICTGIQALKASLALLQCRALATTRLWCLVAVRKLLCYEPIRDRIAVDVCNFLSHLSSQTWATDQSRLNPVFLQVRVVQASVKLAGSVIGRNQLPDFEYNASVFHTT